MIDLIAWRRGPWLIQRETNGAGNPCLTVIGTTLRTAHVDHPVQWPDGRIAYDFPERVPAYVKAAVARLMPTLKASR